jgi:glucosamine kinase
MSDWFIGIDGGGTRTRALALDELGNELARVEGPAALADPRAPGAAALPIAEVARSAAKAAGRLLPCSALWAGIAGVGREATRAAVEQAVEREGLARRLRVGTDARAAFYDAFEGGPGILVIAGTGSVAYGRSEAGRDARVGGWGTLLGDEGSGYAIGLEGLRRVARAADGRGDPTVLEETMLQHLGLSGADGLIAWTANAQKSDIAALVPVIVDASRKGDGVAREILTTAVDDLVRHVRTLLTTLGPWERPPSVALTGGVLAAGRPLRRPVEEALARQHLPLLERELDPTLGAAKLARTIGGQASG